MVLWLARELAGAASALKVIDGTGSPKDKDGNLFLIGTMPVPHSKDKASPRGRKDKGHLVRQGATVFKGEAVG
jgi:hypothetical protein